MANSKQYQKVVDKRASGAHKLLSTSETRGRVRIAYATYEAASLAADSVINLFDLPFNARLISGEVTHDDVGSGVTLDVGYTATTAAGAAASDADKFLDGGDVASAAGTIALFATEALGKNNVIGGTNTDDINIDTNQDGVLVTATVLGGAATGTISATVQYVVD